ncbi:peroxidase 29 [Quercus suber]|uniref:Peroxidase 29 n=1 Tax=Quercus suber TaxID=58331 RepID=A0AAW0KXF0_QUESU
MEPRFEAFLRLNCPKWSLISNLTFVLNDPTTFIFDNLYYLNAMGGRGVLRIDVEMHFATDHGHFFHAFSTAFVMLSTLGILTGNQGVNVIRKH